MASARKAFLKEQFAIGTDEGSWLATMIHKENPGLLDKVSLGPIPLTDDPDGNLIGVISTSLCISKYSKNIDVAKEFLNWLVSDERALEYMTKELKNFPSINAFKVNEEELGTMVIQTKNYINGGKTKTNLHGWIPSAIKSELGSIPQRFLLGELDRKETLEAFTEAFRKNANKN